MKFINNHKAILGTFIGKKEDDSDWVGIIFAFENDSYPYLFMWDILNTEEFIAEDDLTIEEIFYIIDSIQSN